MSEMFNERELTTLKKSIESMPWAGLVDWKSSYVGHGWLWVYSMMDRYEYLMVTTTPKPDVFFISYPEDQESRQTALVDRTSVLEIIHKYVAETVE